MKKYSIAATTDIGVSRERQEDYIFFKELDEKIFFVLLQMVQVLVLPSLSQPRLSVLKSAILYRQCGKIRKKIFV